jgi:hypothetical protein
MRVTKTQLKTELEKVYKESGGDKLLPSHVVSWAEKHPKSALHRRFEWNDTVAGQKYRIYQARHIIEEIYLTPDYSKFKYSAPEWISLTPDRVEGGYRKLLDVLSDKEMRQQLLIDAFRDFEVWQRKYQMIKELNDIIESALKVKKRLL